MEKTEVVAKIIEYVGGKDNVVNTWHCMTRLRFELKDTSKIQEDAIKALDGVIGVQFAKGQLQIVLGTSVHKYYDIALQMLDLKEDIAAPAQPEKKKDFISWFMDMDNLPELIDRENIYDETGHVDLEFMTAILQWMSRMACCKRLCLQSFSWQVRTISRLLTLWCILLWHAIL